MKASRSYNYSIENCAFFLVGSILFLPVGILILAGPVFCNSVIMRSLIVFLGSLFCYGKAISIGWISGLEYDARVRLREISFFPFSLFMVIVGFFILAFLPFKQPECIVTILIGLMAIGFGTLLCRSHAQELG